MPVMSELSAEQIESVIVRTLQEHGDVRSAFIKMDQTRSGHISAEELRVGLQSYGIEISPEVARQIVRKYDKTGQFNYEEFVHFYEGPLTTHLTTYALENSAAYIGSSRFRGSLETVHKTLRQEQQELVNLVREKLMEHGHSDSRSRHLADVFIHFDQDRSGFLTYSEIHYGLNVIGIELSTDQLLMLTDTMDPRHTGKISLYDFLGFVQGRQSVPTSNVSDSPKMEQKKRKTSLSDSYSSTTSSTPRWSLPHVYDVIVKDGDNDKKAIEKIVQVFEDKRMKLMDAFRRMDTDCTGKLSLELFMSGLDHIGVSITEPRARRLLQKYSAGDNTLSYTEFVRMISTTLSEHNVNNSRDVMQQDTPNVQEDNEDDLMCLQAISAAVYSTYHDTHKMFNKLDKTGDKRITQEDFLAHMQKLGVSLSEEEVGSLFKRFDRDGSGTLRYCEFLRMLAAAGAR
eukprot:NODE_96_length_1635_cov_524.596154_g94_i0.p1 GENE.NODE_96_length_1635_cov_524.596154_g94_i0~~NODE_96_length_1635_cov_524.596154_g94_i0.p1  ORF type:complete len:456 (-),score=70.42 NODE_96_length_1635_cov_524.596154_g94_i0:174-1541(-)